MLTKAQEAWLQALESGDYGQCAGHLKDKKLGRYRHCCLGIITELFGTELEKAQIFEMTHLTDRLIELMSMRGPVGELEPAYEINGLHFHSLAMLNDNSFTFVEIAAIVRKYPEKVFT